MRSVSIKNMEARVKRHEDRVSVTFYEKDRIDHEHLITVIFDLRSVDHLNDEQLESLARDKLREALWMNPAADDYSVDAARVEAEKK